MDVIKILQKSYKRICSPYCEDNLNSFKISMTDDPGWYVKIEVEGLAATRIEFEDIKYNNGNEDWLDICLDEYYFKARGDINKLEKILTIFCNLFLQKYMD